MQCQGKAPRKGSRAENTRKKPSFSIACPLMAHVQAIVVAQFSKSENRTAFSGRHQRAPRTPRSSRHGAPRPHVFRPRPQSMDVRVGWRRSRHPPSNHGRPIGAQWGANDWGCLVQRDDGGWTVVAYDADVGGAARAHSMNGPRQKHRVHSKATKRENAANAAWAKALRTPKRMLA